MKFSKLSKKQLIGLIILLILLISLPLAVFLVKQQQEYRGRAVVPEARPTNVKIANLHGGGFSVSWTSANPSSDNQFVETTGWIERGTTNNNLDQKDYDDRGGENFSSTTHHISIFNLQPETTYYFKIKSGPDLYGLNVAGDRWVKGGTAKEQATPKTLDLTGNPHPIYGFIKKDGNLVAGALVYVRLKKDDSETKSALMSAVTGVNEGWVVDAENARKQGLGSFFDFDGNDRVLIDVQAGLNGTASADFAISNSSPAPDITVAPPTGTPTPTSTLTPTGTPTPSPTLSPTPAPVETPTPTPSPAPGKAHLTFKVKFQGIIQQKPDKTISLILAKGGNIINTFNGVSVNSDRNGIYSGKIMNITPDTYDIFIKGWVHLQKKFPGITLVAGENNQDFSGTELLTGDSTGDNKVNAQDIVILVQDYRPNTPPESLADFNLDGVVNAQDVRFMVENYRQEGE